MILEDPVSSKKRLISAAVFEIFPDHSSSGAFLDKIPRSQGATF